MNFANILRIENNLMKTVKKQNDDAVTVKFHDQVVNQFWFLKLINQIYDDFRIEIRCINISNDRLT